MQHGAVSPLKQGSHVSQSLAEVCGGDRGAGSAPIQQKVILWHLLQLDFLAGSLNIH